MEGQKSVTVWTKYFIESETSYLALLELMLWIIGAWATISKMSALENIALNQLVFLYFYPQYLTYGNSKAYQTYHFLKELNNIFQVHLNILPKLWLMFCCYQQYIQKMSHFWPFNDHNSRSKNYKYTNDAIFSSTFWARSVAIFHFCNSRTSNFSSTGSPFCLMFCSVKYTFTC